MRTSYGVASCRVGAIAISEASHLAALSCGKAHKNRKYRDIETNRFAISRHNEAPMRASANSNSETDYGNDLLNPKSMTLQLRIRAIGRYSLKRELSSIRVIPVRPFS
ncbi:hypothetical protein V1478_009088 [Vespula squamosa]|uniref:Uncharacterized protein n=1 Tax=Vespula squamosa TaxID=30214 RepID=A0ABD2ARE5_VESSQ